VRESRGFGVLEANDVCCWNEHLMGGKGRREWREMRRKSRGVSFTARFLSEVALVGVPWSLRAAE
jgi:hypothetical protein